MSQYPYWVRHDGIDYAPGTDVPDEKTIERAEQEPVAEQPKEPAKRGRKAIK